MGMTGAESRRRYGALDAPFSAGCDLRKTDEPTVLRLPAHDLIKWRDATRIAEIPEGRPHGRLVDGANRLGAEMYEARKGQGHRRVAYTMFADFVLINDLYLRRHLVVEKPSANI